jgi:hypothetical protein
LWKATAASPLHIPTSHLRSTHPGTPGQPAYIISALALAETASSPTHIQLPFLESGRGGTEQGRLPRHGRTTHEAWLRAYAAYRQERTYRAAAHNQALRSLRPTGEAANTLRLTCLLSFLCLHSTKVYMRNLRHRPHFHIYIQVSSIHTIGTSPSHLLSNQVTPPLTLHCVDGWGTTLSA